MQAQLLPSYTVTTVAGNGTAGYAGDNGAATSSILNFPLAMARSNSGTLYISDNFNLRIRSVQSDGIIRTVVGTGTRGFTGDGGAATSALINSPYGIAVDGAGNLYFTDSLNHTVRKVSASGTITLIAGTGRQGFAGDGEDALVSNLNLPTGIAVDSAGNVLFSDSQNNRIRKIGTDGKISTFAGSGNAASTGDGGPVNNASFYNPQGLAFDSAGNLYIADMVNHRIRKVDTSGTVTTIAGSGVQGFAGDNGAATSAQLSYPRGVYVDASGTVFIADTNNNRIRAVTEDGVIHTVAGNGVNGDGPDNVPAETSALRYPRAIVSNGAGGFYILDSDNHRVRLLTPNVAAPLIRSNGIISSSEYGGFPTVGRGSWIEVHGAGLAQGTRSWDPSDFVNGVAPTSLSGTSVTIGGRPTFVSYISPQQVNVQVPDDVLAGTYPVVVNSPLGASSPYLLTIVESQPGLYAPPSMNTNGIQYAGVMMQDGKVVSTDHLPKPGETVTLFGIGFGNVAPYEGTGQVVRRTNSVVTPVQAYYGDKPATITYAGMAAGQVGIYQFNIVVPTIPGGDQIPLRFEVNGRPVAQSLYTGVAASSGGDAPPSMLTGRRKR